MVTYPDKNAGESRVRYEPAHGREFDVTIVRELDHYATSRTTDRVSYLVLGSVIGAIGLAAIYGMITGKFGGLRNVWDAGGPIVGPSSDTISIAVERIQDDHSNAYPCAGR